MGGVAERGPDESEAMSEHDERDDYDDADWVDVLAAKHLVRWPGAAMWTFGVVQLILVQLWIAFIVTMWTLANFVDDDRTFAEAWRTVTNNRALWGSFVLWPIATICACAMIHGANGFRRYDRYSWAVVGAILLSLSVPCPCLLVAQLPFGIWSIVLLLRRDVRARFDAVARAARSTNVTEDT
jgi:hypothetical protein